MNYKNIHIGQMIKKEVAERGTEMSRICNFMKCTENEIQEMYKSVSMDTQALLRWSTLLEYDFFRLYSQYLILYAPPSKAEKKHVGESKKSSLPQFRKNIYTKEVIDFILEQIQTGEKTKNDIIREYGIPKTTLYKWINKYIYS